MHVTEYLIFYVKDRILGKERQRKPTALPVAIEGWCADFAETPPGDRDQARRRADDHTLNAHQKYPRISPVDCARSNARSYHRT